MDISITTTEAENLALSYSHTDFEFYLTSVAQGQVNLAVEEIAKIAIDKCLETDTPVPGSKAEMVALAFAQGWVKTAAARQEEAEAAAAAMAAGQGA
jgi:hypothetical protein